VLSLAQSLLHSDVRPYLRIDLKVHEAQFTVSLHPISEHIRIIIGYLIPSSSQAGLRFCCLYWSLAVYYITYKGLVPLLQYHQPIGIISLVVSI